MNGIFLNYVKALLLSFLITFSLILILSLFLTYSNLSDTIINPGIIIISGISVLVGGFNVSRKNKGKGILNGGILGIIYIIILFLISSILNSSFSVNISSLIMISICIIAGAIGGILGVNSKPEYKK